jgi:tRNA threonylcarbamoyladenosine biosynthesis protein TsaB
LPSEKLVLGFDTSAAHCAAALVCGAQLLASASEDMARGQAERLIPLLTEVLQAGGHVWADLDALAVGVGPGNFTGIRIAVSAARGLALGLDIPAVGVSVFEARAEGLPRPLTVAEDARRNEVYVQDFTPEPGEALLLDAADAQGFGGFPVVGSAAAFWAARTGGQVLEPRYPLTEAIARMGARKATSPRPARPAPLYIRPADAAPPAERPPLILP